MPTKDRGGLKHPAGGDQSPGSDDPWIVPEGEPAGDEAEDEGADEQGEAPAGNDG